MRPGSNPATSFGCSSRMPTSTISSACLVAEGSGARFERRFAPASACPSLGDDRRPPQEGVCEDPEEAPPSDRDEEERNHPAPGRHLVTEGHIGDEAADASGGQQSKLPDRSAAAVVPKQDYDRHGAAEERKTVIHKCLPFGQPSHLECSRRTGKLSRPQLKVNMTRKSPLVLDYTGKSRANQAICRLSCFLFDGSMPVLEKRRRQPSEEQAPC